jgi:outer membrane scaffolding protein for murein synthesis (MipA/OmpV family)
MAAIALLGLCASPAAAQDVEGDNYTNRPNSLTVGIGGAYHPSYEGSDDYKLSPMILAVGKVGGFSFSAHGTNLSVDLLRGVRRGRLSFQLGPVLNLRLNRSNRVKDPQVSALGRIGRAVEVGGHAGVTYHHLLNRYDGFSVRLSWRHDVSRVHDSSLWGPAVTYRTPMSRHAYLVVGAHAEHVGTGFGRTYFGVTAPGAARSGLPAYAAKGGWKDYRLSLLVARTLVGDLRHPRVSAFGGFGYSRELGNFSRSPIVRLAGSADQYLATAGLAYSF